MMSATVPDILLERYRLNELSQDEADRLTERIRVDPQLRERLDALAQSDEEMRRNGAADRLVARLEQHVRASGRAPQRPARSWAIPAAAAAATVTIVAIALVSRPLWPHADGKAARAPNDALAESGADRIKGLLPSLAVYRRTAGGSETLADGAVARPGDVVRVAYHPAGRAYGVIFSIDGRGAVTMHLPPAGDQAVPLAREATALLDQAYELDDAPPWERFYFVTGDTPFPAAPVIEAARRAAGEHRPAHGVLTLPSGLEHSTFSLQKEARP